METVQIETIRVEGNYYPRAEHNQSQVDLYRQSLDSLPPISVNQNHILIDGYHRMLAHLQEGKDEITAIVEELPDEDVLVESIKRNAVHGLQLSMGDKRRLSVELYLNGMPDTGEIAELLSVHRNTVLNWTSKAREEQRSKEDEIIWNMWLACATEEDIAEELDLARKTINERIGKIHKDVKIANPDPLRTFNHWYFDKPDDRFGIDYPGRIPGQIVQHLLYYYTEPFDVVMDLFGGGGVTVDVCKSMARRYRVYDIRPVLPEIVEHDVTTGVPGGYPLPQLVILDPPYWSQKKGDYSEHETNLANMELDQFYDELEKIIRQSLDKADNVALIIGATQHEHDFIDHTAQMIWRIGKPKQRIIVPYTTQQYGGAQVNRAKEGKYMLNLYRDLIIWE